MKIWWRNYWNGVGYALAVVILVGLAACATLVWQTSDDERDLTKTAAIGDVEQGGVDRTNNTTTRILALLEELEERLAAVEGRLDIGGSDEQ